MSELLVVGGLLLLVPGAMLVVLRYLDNVEAMEKKELQKLLKECFDSK